MSKVFRNVLILSGLAIFSAASLHAAQSLMITPTTFDFGWCPDNAKISADFSIKNTGVDVIPITSVQPTCGCTASQFTPGNLASNEETKVSLTFNTRGYAGGGFNKTAKVKTDAGAAEYTVNLTGVVADPNAKIFPDHGGIAGFEPGSKEKKKTIKIENKTDKDVDVTIVRKPAGWAQVALGATNIKAGDSAALEISVDGPYDQAQDTSVTLEATPGPGAPATRVTVAIRTGPPPSAIRTMQTAPKPEAAKPTPTPKPQAQTKSKKK